MKIGILSDTHRNKKNIHLVSELLVQHKHINSIYHLGDDYDDVLELQNLGVDVVQVPGLYDKKYFDSESARKHVETIYGIRILLIHSLDKDGTDNDITNSDIILYGHTHKGEIQLSDAKLFINPGHLKSDMDKNSKPSFGYLEILEKKVTTTLFNLQFKIVESHDYLYSEIGFYKI